MPQLEQFDTYLSQIFWLLVTFGVLYFTMSRVLIPRMVSILEARVFQVESDQRRAEETKLEAEEFGSRIAYMVSNAQMEGDRMRTEITLLEREKTDKRLAEIEQQITAKIAESERLLAARHDQTLKNAEKEIVQVVQKVLGKVLGSDYRVTSEELRHCVREQIDTLPDALSDTLPKQKNNKPQARLAARQGSES